jgi:hypothetical protein
VVDIDLEKFFDRVNHDCLMARVAARIADRRVLKLIRAFLNAGVMEDGMVLPVDEGTPLRSTDAQKAERLNAAHSLLVGGIDMADAVVSLSRQFGISRRQAYRYLQEAQAIGHAVPLVAPSVPITLKMPANLARDVRAYAVLSGLTISEVVTRAITAFLTAVRGHG